MSPRFVDAVRDRTRRWLWFLSIAWLLLAVTVIVYDFVSSSDWPRWLTRIYFYATIACSAAAFFLYGWDKRQARLGRWRIRERTLHRLSMWGGWPGAILGQQFFRHKTEKIEFRVKSGLILIAHLLIILWGVQSFLFSFL